VGGRHQQSPQRLGLPFSLERPPEGECSSKRNRDPEDASRSVLGCLPFLHEREREYEYARNREEERRIGDFEAAHFDGEVLPEYEPHSASEAALASRRYRRVMDQRRIAPLHSRLAHSGRHQEMLARPITARYVDLSASGRATRSTTRPSRRNSALSSRPSARSRSCVARMTIALSCRSPRSLAINAAADASSSPVNGSSSSTSRGR